MGDHVPRAEVGGSSQGLILPSFSTVRTAGLDLAFLIPEDHLIPGVVQTQRTCGIDQAPPKGPCRSSAPEDNHRTTILQAAALREPEPDLNCI